MKGDDLAGDLALEKVDLLLQRGEHPLHISRRLVRDLLNGTEARVRFFVLIVRNPGDAIFVELGLFSGSHIQIFFRRPKLKVFPTATFNELAKPVLEHVRDSKFPRL